MPRLYGCACGVVVICALETVKICCCLAASRRVLTVSIDCGNCHLRRGKGKSMRMRNIYGLLAAVTLLLLFPQAVLGQPAADLGRSTGSPATIYHGTDI